MNVYEIITQRIIEQLEKGTVPWRKPWNVEGGFPKNLVSRKAYRGINVFLLHSLGYESPYYVTYNQAKELGGHVRKGEKGCPIVFWKGNWQPKSKARTTRHEGADKPKNTFVLRYFTVFNVAAQCEGIEVPATTLPERTHSPLEAADRIVEAMPKRPGIHIGSRQACYIPSLDEIRMPRPETFTSAEAYYATLFHEIGHSTGHSSRLDRKLDTLATFGSADYSREELVAEMTSAFLCGTAGILDARLEQSTAYLQGWLQRLRGDARLVVIAAAQAQKAAEYVLGGGVNAPADEE